MIIDTETHVVYRVFPIEANPTQSRVFRPSWHQFDGDLFIDEMNRAGVDHTFLISYDAVDILWYLQTEGYGLEDVLAGRKFTRTYVDKYPDRFLWFATIKHPDRPETKAEIARDLDDGVLGFKIFPAYLNISADHPGLMDVYRLCLENNRRVILSFEDTLPPTTPDVTQYFEQLDKILTEFPNLQVQLNHAGGGAADDPASDPLNPEAEIVFRVTNSHDNLLLSTAWLAKNWDDKWEYPFPNYLRRLQKLYDEVGVEKLVWATDWPWLEQYMNYPQAVDSIRKHANFMTDEDKRLFLGENARKFMADLVPALSRPSG
jgi:predicted TIM-barrel fold metal-dependent hydrolase